MSRPARRWIGLLGGVVLASGCQERLTGPAECPALCPGGSQTILETVVTAVFGADTSFVGYVERGAGSALLTSNGLEGSSAHAVYRFVSREDSVVAGGVKHGFVVDSVLLALNLVARDTLVDGLSVQLYRVPPETDNTTSFADLEVQLVPANLIADLPVADGLRSGALSVILRGADLARVALPPGTGGALAIGVAITAATPTGIRLGAQFAGLAATFTSFVTVNDLADTDAEKKQTLSRVTAFNTFVTQSTPAPDPSLLLVGGAPSSRALIRFALSPALLDTARIVRATLELVPNGPIGGLPSDPALLQSRLVVADLGAKSPLDPLRILQDTLPIGSADTVRFEVTQLVKSWQASDIPQAVFLQLVPEAASFTEVVFGSTRSAAGGPRLRITYLLPFPFESP